MMAASAAHPQPALVELARDLGRADRAWAILAEGNCSAAIDGSTAWVKVSGTFMADAVPADFVTIDVDEFIAVVTDPRSDDDTVRAVFDVLAGANGGRRPSVEALLHALCLRQSGVNYVGHTHPIPLNAVLCSAQARLLTAGALFPDQIVVVGPRPLFVPYVDPGLALAREIATLLDARGNDVPRAIYLQNHGFFALGATAAEVVQITEMAVKSAQILLGTAALGGPRFLDATDVERIDSRLDEQHRRALLLARTAP